MIRLIFQSDSVCKIPMKELKLLPITFLEKPELSQIFYHSLKISAQCLQAEDEVKRPLSKCFGRIGYHSEDGP